MVPARAPDGRHVSGEVQRVSEDPCDLTGSRQGGGTTCARGRRSRRGVCGFFGVPNSIPTVTVSFVGRDLCTSAVPPSISPLDGAPFYGPLSGRWWPPARHDTPRGPPLTVAFSRGLYSAPRRSGDSLHGVVQIDVRTGPFGVPKPARRPSNSESSADTGRMVR